MRTLTAIACLALFAATLAGCAEDRERYPDGVSATGSASRSQTASPTATRTGSSTATSTGPGGNGTNQAPTANLTATPSNGSFPLAVNFTLAGMDPDGDPLNWTLSFGDGNQTNGTKLPTTVPHTYPAAGNYTANLTVTDGQSSTHAEVAIIVNGTSGGAFEPMHVEGSVAILCPQCSQRYNACAGLLANQSGTDCLFFELPPEAAGHIATVESSNGFVNVDVMADCSGMGAGLYSFIDDTGSSPYSFEIPEGAGCFLLYEWADVPPSLVVDIV